MSALPPKADIKLRLSKGAANDPKQTSNGSLEESPRGNDVLSTRWRTRVYIIVNSATGPQVSTVKTVADPQLKPLDNGHKLRKVPHVMRNFSYLKEFFY